MSSMQQSTRANLALRRGRDHLFDREVGPMAELTEPIAIPPAPHQVRQRFRHQLAEEGKSDRKWMAIILISILLLTGVLLYWLVM